MMQQGKRESGATPISQKLEDIVDLLAGASRFRPQIEFCERRILARRHGRQESAADEPQRSRRRRSSVIEFYRQTPFMRISR